MARAMSSRLISYPRRLVGLAAALLRRGEGPARARSAVDRIATGLAVAGGSWVLLAAAWGLFGPVVAGHYGSMASFGIIGENMLTWRILGCVWDYVLERPVKTDYYAHHPWGNYWITAAFLGVFGRHDFVLSLPAVLMSAATPVLLFDLARRAFSKVAGAAAVVGFVLLPITVGFANLHNMEVSVIFGCALFFWGQQRLLESYKRRFLVLSVAGAALAAAVDWPAYPILASLLAWGFLRAFALPRAWTPPLAFRRYTTWWAFSVAAVGGMLALWIYLFHDAGKIDDWLRSAQMRGSGGGLEKLSDVLRARRHWNELMFTPVAIAIGKLALPVVLSRFLIRRHDVELYSVAALVGATVHYVAFKQAADIHIFWAHYFALYFALALAQLVHTVELAIDRAARRFEPPFAAGAAAALLLLVLYAVAIAPDTVRSLEYARQTGGRYNERGHPIRSEHDAVLVLERLGQRLGPREVVAFHAGFHYTWLHGWALHGPVSIGRGLPRPDKAFGDRAFFVARASSLSAREQRQLVTRHFVEIYDDVWVVDLRRPPAPLVAHTFAEREPTAWEWYFRGGALPIRWIEPDPFKTWEWRVHLGQPAEPPTVEPVGLEQLRIAHNVAVEIGDAARAERLEARILERLAPLPDDQRRRGLVGKREIDGVQPRVELWFRAEAGATSGPARFAVLSEVIAPKPWQVISVDPVVRDSSAPWILSTELWRPGFLYAHTVPLRQRIGVERYIGEWDGAGAAELDEGPVLLATMP